MRALVLGVVMAAFSGGQAFAQDGFSGCGFALSPSGEALEIIGSPAVTERLRVMAQPDSPVQIIRVDVSGLSVTGGAGSFTITGQQVVLVRNISDQRITDTTVMLRTGFGAKSGVGSAHVVGPLNPGEQIRFSWSSGRGMGINEAGTGDASIVAMVEEVTTESCTYRPSQSWPLAAVAGRVSRR